MSGEGTSKCQVVRNLNIFPMGRYDRLQTYKCKIDAIKLSLDIKYYMFVNHTIIGSIIGNAIREYLTHKFSVSRN